MNIIIKRYLANITILVEDKQKIKEFGGHYGLALNQMLLLYMVKKHGKKFMTEDKRHIGTNPSYNLKVLEKNGYIRSDRKNRDRRRIFREITLKGEELLKKFDEAHKGE